MMFEASRLKGCSAATFERVREDGRWDGAICRRRFPDDDETSELSADVRSELANVWYGQAATEARVAESFTVVHRALENLGADGALVDLAERAIDDEHRHATLCEELAGRYAGQRVSPHRPLPSQMPQHPTASSHALRSALWVVGQCAFNETLATAYLSAALEGAQTPLARHAIRELMEDEIDHSRVGWAFLAELTDAEKRPLAEWLLPLAVSNFREWNKLRLPETDRLARFGVPSYDAAHAAIREALHGVVVAGFAHVGVDTTALASWLERGAPTELGKAS